MTVSMVYFLPSWLKRDISAVQKLPQQIIPVKQYLDDCVSESFRRGIYLSAIRGGLIYDAPKKLFVDNEALPYYFYLAGITTPTVDDVKKQLVRFVREDLKRCEQSADVFRDRGFKFLFGQSAGNVVFSEDTATLSLTWDVKVGLDKSETHVTQFSSKVPLRLSLLHDLSSKFAQSMIFSKTLVMPVAPDNFITYQLFPYDEETIIYSITDVFSEPPLVFMFAMKTHKNSAPVFDAVPVLFGSVGDVLAYNLTAHDADGDVLFFSADDSRLLVHPTNGLLQMFPTNAGKFTTKVRVKDSLGASDEKEVRIIIYSK
ncbi:hypothetical protein HY484_02015 [Candidatus Woesearchaeota archaeon]|nr:hypothetical protein [Candidatus Woesearchaeota archaeon]